MADTPTLNTNSYVTVAMADAFFANRPDASLWAAFTAEQKAQGLLAAFAGMNRLKYAGHPTVSTQPAPWPRQGVRDLEGIAYATNAVPQPVKDAQCLEALARLQVATQVSAQRQTLQAQGVTRYTLGDLTEEYDLSTAVKPGKHVHSADAYAVLKPLLLGSQRW